MSWPLCTSIVLSAALLCSVWAGPGKAQVEISGDLACYLSAEQDVGSDPQSGLAFDVTLDCPTGKPPASQDPVTLFSGTAGIQLIVGASLTDPINDAPLADFDFPIRIVMLAPGGQDAWRLTAPPSAQGLYQSAVFRLWTTQALADCVSGRDGCNKYGYILLWDQRLDTDLLIVALQ
ncbi:hypothetical protein [Ruegeria atlantica]|uniref:hypothetical protein n=1 Tax=Ruegeria atlantica TaxID=81569 RepID=UPI00147CB573|nr:hypothetical protein [Ruegeria atlantica]